MFWFIAERFTGVGAHKLRPGGFVLSQQIDITVRQDRSSLLPTAGDSRPPEAPRPDVAESCRVPIRSLLPADSPREYGEDAEHVRTLVEAGAELPPIIVHRATMRVIDGMHRMRAAMIRGDETIEVRFFDGTEQDAFVLAVRANVTHGLPLSRSDRARAAERLVALYPTWSDRTIASAAGLGTRSVAAIRLSLHAGEGPVARIGRDGRVRPLDNAEGRIRASAILRERPEASLREVAREAAISPSTVRDVKQRMTRGEDPVPPGRGQREADHPAPHERFGGQEADEVAVNTILKGLQSDPSLRFSESGRSLLRWILSRAVRADERLDVVGKVPPHCSYLIADVARRCANEWLQLASDLERRNEETREVVTVLRPTARGAGTGTHRTA
ncbi:ParB N-terminal domain-containing protein [Polymorphospora rubra]|uniref:ParB-like N-terminal domain-containing protein n=2 Tax=Polymorphospora rubra TaxID=338584 RepID=A0A810N7C1_9ACTN|nr:hypothetical protein Prubr_65030 [Polymorphospora rubra]